jgi:hypothetical protein
MRPCEIADCLDKSRVAVRKMLSRMVRDNQLERTGTSFYNLKCAAINDPANTERDQARKEKSRQLIETFKSAYRTHGQDVDEVLETEYDFPEDLSGQIALIYGNKKAVDEIKPADQTEPASPAEEAVSDNDASAAQGASEEPAPMSLKQALSQCETEGPHIAVVRWPTYKRRW